MNVFVTRINCIEELLKYTCLLDWCCAKPRYVQRVQVPEFYSRDLRGSAVHPFLNPIDSINFAGIQYTGSISSSPG